jgi:hypothetical protein
MRATHASRDCAVAMQGGNEMNVRIGRVLGMLAIVSGLAVIGAASASAGQPGTILFQEGTPGTYTWTVPKGVRHVTFTVVGAAGGHNGGRGGLASATLQVKFGQVFEIVVGGQGAETGAGGFNGGGDGQNGGGGGGASDIRAGACALTQECNLVDRFLIAGGGGGSVTLDDVTSTGGSGGGIAGGAAVGGAGSLGQGGSQIEGGAEGGNAGPGSLGEGGDWNGGGGTCASSCGGGGGGLFGGGAGYNGGGGGGGSGFVSGLLLSSTMLNGFQPGDGTVIITDG